MKFDAEKFKTMMRGEYVKRYNRQPGAALERLIDCLEDATVEEWVKDIGDTQERLVEQAQSVLSDLQRSTASAKTAAEALRDERNKKKETFSGVEVKDERMTDALNAYLKIVSLDCFETPQQKLQNIQNASYFIWAMCNDGSDAAFRDLNLDKISNVKEEDTRTNKEIEEESKWHRAEGDYGRKRY